MLLVGLSFRLLTVFHSGVPGPWLCRGSHPVAKRVPLARPCGLRPSCCFPRVPSPALAGVRPPALNRTASGAAGWMLACLCGLPQPPFVLLPAHCSRRPGVWMCQDGGHGNPSSLSLSQPAARTGLPPALGCVLGSFRSYAVSDFWFSAFLSFNPKHLSV